MTKRAATPSFGLETVWRDRRRLLWLTAAWFLSGTGAVTALAISTGSRALALGALAAYAGAFSAAAAAGTKTLLLTMVAVTPLVTVELGFGDPSATLSADKVVLALLTLVFLVQHRRYREALSTPAWIVSISLSGIVAIAAFRMAVMGFAAQDVMVLARNFSALAALLMALSVFRSRSARVQLLRCVIWSAGAVSLLTLVQFSIYRWHGSTIPLFFKSGTILDAVNWYSMPSTIGHKNFLGGYLAMTVMVTAASLVKSRVEQTRVVVASLALQIATILVARSIGTTAGLSIACALGIVLVGPRARPATRIAFLVAGTGAVALAALYLFWSPQSLWDRVEIYRVTMRMVREHPWLGIGPAGFARDFSFHYAAVFGRAWEYGGSAAHNAFLDVLVSWGFPGFVCFVTALGALFVYAGNTIRRGWGHEAQSLAAGLWLGLVGFTFNAMSENLFSFSKLTALFWVLGGALVQETERATERCE